METENKDWKPEVGKTAWYFCGMTNKRVFCATVLSLDENEQVGKTAIVDGLVDGNRLINVRYLYPSMEAALASIKIYDLDGKEVVIPRAQDEIAMLKTELVVANAIIDNLSPRLEAALERILELQEEKEEWELEGGGAAIGGKSDAREGGC